MIVKIVSCFKTLMYVIKYNRRLRITKVQLIPFSSHLTIKDNSSITVCGRIRAAENCEVFSMGGGELSIDDVSLNKNCIIGCRNKIVIGKNCLFGPNVCVYDHNHLFDEKQVFGSKYLIGPIIIEDNCWLGANVVVLRNTVIGEGSVIGAGTVVQGIIPPHSIVTSENRKLIIKSIQSMR